MICFEIFVEDAEVVDGCFNLAVQITTSSMFDGGLAICGTAKADGFDVDDDVVMLKHAITKTKKFKQNELNLHLTYKFFQSGFFFF